VLSAEARNYGLPSVQASPPTDALSAALAIATATPQHDHRIVGPAQTERPVADAHAAAHGSPSLEDQRDTSLEMEEDSASAGVGLPTVQQSPPAERLPAHRQGRYMLRLKLQGETAGAHLVHKAHVGRLLSRTEKVKRQRVDLPRNVAYDVDSENGGLVACPCCMLAYRQSRRQGEGA
jgi:hypothetical protein